MWSCFYQSNPDSSKDNLLVVLVTQHLLKPELFNCNSFRFLKSVNISCAQELSDFSLFRSYHALKEKYIPHFSYLTFFLRFSAVQKKAVYLPDFNRLNSVSKIFPNADQRYDNASCVKADMTIKAHLHQVTDRHGRSKIVIQTQRSYHSSRCDFQSMTYQIVFAAASNVGQQTRI